MLSLVLPVTHAALHYTCAAPMATFDTRVLSLNVTRYNSLQMDTYINTLDGFITIFLSGVIHKGTLLLQEHLDAVDGPSSEREKGASVEMIDELTT